MKREFTMQNKKNFNLPIKYAVTFSAITFLLYLIGPYRYPDINRGLVVTFIVVTNVFMYLGFSIGTKYVLTFGKRRRNYSTPKDGYYNHTFLGYSASQIINFLFWIALIDCVPKFIIYSGAYNMSLSEVWSNVLKFFSSAQDIYAARQSLSSVTGIWRYINYFIVLTGPLYWAYTPLALLYWKQLTCFKKIGSFVIWFFYLLQYLVTGTNVGFFDFFLTVLVVSLVKTRIGNQNKVLVEKKKSPLLLIVVVGTILFFVFDTIMGSRIGDQYLKGGSLGLYKYTFNTDSLIWKIVPESLKAMISYLTRYLANAYNAIAYAIDLPFQSTFGLGHSWFVLDNLSTGLSKGLWARTYNMQIEELYGFGHYANWHTAYIWFANDVSFVGVPILFFFLYYYFGRAWKRFLQEKDLFCFLRFMIFVKMSYFISANNQIFQNSDTLFAFWGLVIITLAGGRLSMERRIDR